MVECCFTFTETVGLLGAGGQDGHLDFHTAPELWFSKLLVGIYIVRPFLSVSVCLSVPPSLSLRDRQTNRGEIERGLVGGGGRQMNQREG